MALATDARHIAELAIGGTNDAPGFAGGGADFEDDGSLTLAGVLRVNASGSATSHFEFEDTLATTGNIRKTSAAGSAIIGLEPIVGDGTSLAKIQIFRDTSTSGARTLTFYKGDGTATIVHTISVAANTLFNAASEDMDFIIRGVGQANAFRLQGEDGFLGLNTAIPTEQLHVTGNAIVTGNIVVDGGNIGITADADLLTLTSGVLTIAGDLAVNGGNITSTGDLTITPGGTDLIIIGRVAIGANAVATSRALTVESRADNEVTGLRVLRSGQTNQYIEIGTFNDGIFNNVGVGKDLIIRNSSTTTGDLLLQTQGANTRMILAFGGNAGFGNITPTIMVSGNEKIGWTSIGGLAIKVTNETGNNTVEGELVVADTATDSAVVLSGTTDANILGVWYESGIADAAEAWVVISGIAEVKADAGGFTRGDRVGSSTTVVGRTQTINAPSNTAHFTENGHALETAAANATGKCILHFN